MRVTGKTKLYHRLWPHTVFFVRRFYRQFKYKGFEKIPAEQPVILAPNHQSAFMDAIVLLEPNGWKNQLSYLVRASIFGSKIGNYFLHGINMLPVYRKDVDGAENMDKNDEVFENCVWLLSNKRRLVLFPEGTHNVHKRLIPLKKGITRIAFSAEERNSFNLGIKIYPVGIYYSDPQKFGSDVLIQAGEPIDMKDYLTVYNENPAKAHIQIKFELEKRLRELMIDIRDEKYYHTIEFLGEVRSNELSSINIDDRFRVLHETVSTMENLCKSDPEQMIVIDSYIRSYSAILEELQIKDKMLSPQPPEINFRSELIILLLTFPTAFYGIVHNYLPFMIPSWITNKYIKDSGFKSSIKVAGAMFLFPIFHILFSVVFYIISGSLGWTLIYFVSLIVGAEVGLWWARRLKRYLAHRNFHKKKFTPAMERARLLREKIISVTETFFSKA